MILFIITLSRDVISPKNAAYNGGINVLIKIRLLAFLCVFALLVSDTTACLASRLARCLAFAATAILCALAKVSRIQSFDMFHGIYPPNSISLI